MRNNTGSSSSSSSGGIGFTGLLTILLIGLKLGGVITWSWWWVLSPLWISALFVLVVLIVMFGLAGIAWLIDDRKAKANLKARLALPSLQPPTAPSDRARWVSGARNDSRIGRRR